jgi:hypothetical protein
MPRPVHIDGDFPGDLDLITQTLAQTIETNMVPIDSLPT